VKTLAVTTDLTHKGIQIGFVVNPLAGIGGPSGNKGSDDERVRVKARTGELSLRAPLRINQFFQTLKACIELERLPLFVAPPGEMGQIYLERFGVSHRLSPVPVAAESCKDDTVKQVQYFLDQAVDLIVFVGGDGTARDICSVIGNTIPVLGIPSGVKMHSGVFAVAPQAAAEVLSKLVSGELTGLCEQEVRDIDEQAFRDGRVLSQHFGDMLVPSENRYLQHVKQGGAEIEELVLLDMVEELRQRILDFSPMLIIFGPGSTTHYIEKALGLDASLLGVDLVEFYEAPEGRLLLSNANASELEACVTTAAVPVFVVLTAIGGQGHIIGRGNQQLTPKLLRAVGKSQVWVVATKTKLGNLNRRPLLMDSSDSLLDNQWAGFIPVICGYQDQVLYPLGWEKRSADAAKGPLTEPVAETRVDVAKLVTVVIVQCQQKLTEAIASGSCRRLFHGRGHLYQGLEWCCIDYFQPVLLVTLFKKPPAQFEALLLRQLAERLVGVSDTPSGIACILLQRRYLAGAPTAAVYGQIPEEWYACRAELKFQLSWQQQNVGFFLDIEPARLWLEGRPKNQRVLNLFAYTCAFSVIACAAGASSVVNIDMSSRSLSVGRRNHALNNLKHVPVKYLPHNIFKSWGKLKKEGPYDTIIIDPPSFQKGSFIASKDYRKVLNKMDALLAKGGQFLACLNAPEILFADFKALVDEACPDCEFVCRLKNNEDFLDSEPERALKMLVYRKVEHSQCEGQQ